MKIGKLLVRETKEVQVSDLAQGDLFLDGDGDVCMLLDEDNGDESQVAVICGGSVGATTYYSHDLVVNPVEVVKEAEFKEM